MPASSSRDSSNKPDVPALEESLGYKFKDRNLLLTALTHKSYHHENPGDSHACNERLEFLGDSVLGLSVSEHLFKHGDAYTESVMSKVKSYIVKGSVLYEIARQLDIGRHLLLGKGEEDTGGRQKKSLLSNALEAIFGAVYMDGGFDASKRLIISLLGGRIETALSSGDFSDYKSELQEESQMRFGLLPEYRVLRQEGQEHRKLFTLEVLIGGKQFGSGIGKSKKEAEALAAKEALETLRSKNRAL
jgi:ribonuclease III